MAVDFASFEKKLNAFVFFHLGADTTCKIEREVSSLTVSLQHPRVYPFSFQIKHETLTRLLENDHQFEDFMLDQLTRYRKSH